MAVSGDGDSGDSNDVEPAWHERPGTLAGASVGALLVLAILFWGVSCVSQSDDPAPASQYYLDPSTSGRDTQESGTSSTSTTETITSTSPPVTTDIDPGDTTTSTTPSTDTTTSFNPSNLPRTRAPSTYDDGRTRPRLNETRTMFPRN